MKKECLVVYIVGETETPVVTEEQRTARLGRAIDRHTMRWLGAPSHAR